MKCPICNSQLSFLEHVNGSFSYKITNGIVDWGTQEFRGGAWGQTVECQNPGCNYTMPDEKVDSLVVYTDTQDHTRTLIPDLKKTKAIQN